MHERETEPLVAVILAMSPVVPPESLNVGVVSLVMLSVLDAPVSDDASKSGADVAVEIVMFSGVLDAEMFPAGSVSVAATAQTPSPSSGRVHEVSEPTV